MEYGYPVAQSQIVESEEEPGGRKNFAVDHDAAASAHAERFEQRVELRDRGELGEQITLARHVLGGGDEPRPGNVS